MQASIPAMGADCCNDTESLSGIETGSGQVLIVHKVVATILNPYQGLKLLAKKLYIHQIRQLQRY